MNIALFVLALRVPSWPWIVFGIVLAVLYLFSLMRKVKQNQGNNVDVTGSPTVPPLVFANTFPLSDESGRLLCKNCGVPFDTTKVIDARQFYAHANRNELFVINCRKCQRISVFLKAEVEAWQGTTA